MNCSEPTADGIVPPSSESLKAYGESAGMSSVVERLGVEPVLFTGVRMSGGSPEPDCVAYVCVLTGNIILCRTYKLPLSDQSQVTLQL
jgi:hypothetical protein